VSANPTAQRLFVPDGLREPEPLTVLSHGKGQQSTALGYMAPLRRLGARALRTRLSPHARLG
jgi:hypothetical protein